MFLRFIGFILVILIIIPLLRAVIGLIVRGFANLVNTDTAPPPKAQKAEVPAGGELRKDPVCGTYVSTATALKKSAGAETIYFCSPECQQRYRG